MGPAGSRNNRPRPARSFLSTAIESFPDGPAARRKGWLYNSAHGNRTGGTEFEVVAKARLRYAPDAVR